VAVLGRSPKVAPSTQTISAAARCCGRRSAADAAVRARPPVDNDCNILGLMVSRTFASASSNLSSVLH